MFVRILQVFAVILYIFAAIGVVAYNGASIFWLIPLLAPALYFVFTLPDISPLPIGRHRAPAVPFNPEQRAKIDARIQELKKGPPHRNKTQYIDSVSRGIPYSDERIDYLEFPDKLVLCEHLRPLEAAMRAAKLPLDNHRPRQVEVQCVMRVNRIREQFQLDECVNFTSVAGPHPHDPNAMVAGYTRCGDLIEEGMYGGPWPPDPVTNVEKKLSPS